MIEDMQPSPSGLFRPTAFERDVTERAARRPPWWVDGPQRRRRYAEWVQAEAEGLAAQLDRLDRPDLGGTAAMQLRGLSRLLAADAGWAAAILNTDHDRRAA